MAVIREDRKFNIQPIGVVKASRGGEIVANAAINSAQKIGEMAYKTGARLAEKRGTEEAMAADRSTIIGFDPQTQNPVALNELSKMGTIRAEAYERIVLRRFEQSMEEELRMKSSEIAMENQNEGTYRNLFDTYIGGMSENASGLYKEYIANTGSVIRERTALALREQAIARAQAEAAAARRENRGRNESTSFSLGMLAANDPNAIQGFNQLLNIDADEASDVATFQGSALNLDSEQHGYVQKFVEGYTRASLANLPAQDLNALRAYTMFGVPAQMSSEAGKNLMAVYGQYLDPSDLETRVAIGSSLSAEINTAYSMATATSQQDALFYRNFEVGNLNLDRANDERQFYNDAQTDLGKALTAYDAYYNYDRDRLLGDPANDTNINNRSSYLATAGTDLTNGFIVSAATLLDYSLDELKTLKTEIEAGNLGPLLANARNSGKPEFQIDDTQAARLGELFAASGNTEDAIKFIDSAIDNRQIILDEQRAIADRTFTDSYVAGLESRVADSPDSLPQILEEMSKYSSATNYDDGVADVKNAAQLSTMRFELLKLDDKLVPLVLDEMKLMSRGAVPFEATPTLNGFGLRDNVAAALEGVPVDERARAIASMAESLPNLDAAAAARLGRNADAIEVKIGEAASAFGQLTTEEIAAKGAEIRESIDGNVELSDEDKLRLYGKLNEVVSSEILSNFAETINPQRRDIISNAIRRGDVSGLTGISDEEKTFLNEYISGIDRDTREDLADNFEEDVDSFVKAEEAKAAIEDTNQIHELVRTNGNLNGLNADGIAQARAYALQTGIPESVRPDGFDVNTYNIPEDAFRNPNYLYEDSVDGYAVRSMIQLARQGAIIPELMRTFQAAAGNTLGEAHLNNALAIWNSVSQGLDPEAGARLRTSIATSSGISAAEIGTLDHLSDLRSAGIPYNLYDEFFKYRDDPTKYQQIIETRLGMSPSDFARDAINGGIFDYNLWDTGPAMQEIWTDYVIGQAIAGASPDQIKRNVYDFSRASYVSDSLVHDLRSPTSEGTFIGFRNQFNNDFERSAAIEYTKVELAYQLGSSNFPNETIENQIKFGREIMNEEFATPRTVGREFKPAAAATVRDVLFDDETISGNRFITFVPTLSSTPNNASFHVYAYDRAGNGSPLNLSVVQPRSEIVVRGAKALEAISTDATITTGFGRLGSEAIEQIFIENMRNGGR